MKNNKGIIIAIIGIAIAIVGIVAALIVTDRLSTKDNATTAVSTTVKVEETTTVPSVTRPKSENPESIVAAVYDSYSEKSANEIIELFCI